MPTTNRYAARLPDTYAKADGSNNEKLLRLNAALLDGAFADVKSTGDMVNLDAAFGKTLDYYGEAAGQPRGGLTDTQYRYMIRNQIARNLVAGDYESVLAGIVNIFEAQPGDVYLVDTPGESGVVLLERLPFATITAAGFTATQAVQFIELLLPVGVRLDAVNLEGTFEFAAAAGVYDEDKGFSDSADPAAQTMGGYLGFAIGEDDGTPLPV